MPIPFGKMFDTRRAPRAERPELAGVDRLLQLAVRVVAASVEAHGHDLARVLLRVHHRAALGDRRREGLLAVDVLAGLDRVDRHDRVPVVGRGDADGVHVWIREQRLVVLVEPARSGFDARGQRLLLRLEGTVLPMERWDAPLQPPFEELGVVCRLVALQVRLVDVAKRRHFDERVLHEDVHELRAAARAPSIPARATCSVRPPHLPPSRPT